MIKPAGNQSDYIKEEEEELQGQCWQVQLQVVVVVVVVVVEEEENDDDEKNLLNSQPNNLSFSHARNLREWGPRDGK